ncbi:hypothetical protein RHSIM_Rhsim07G0069800 [Rhododendron simsii]|uniref:Uncharacterized protein n=1 Tax=Rhododendron simsii TaxID=118357 RepID=A0A834GKA2_RHOSS|nr:hypothetical protein RHSIM_Rhsim07G0070100 [Rhododendron simsii]KAF7138736.1 hypothetical protein RHSIM_Rhsim07G0069900 [Rhododendron simsii]KAF7139192.1 hypothetical protein RHSIM_Rhsim07G0069800 [Rhododendron simsii]
MAKQSHCAGGGDGLKAWEGGGATMWLMATRRLIGDQRLMRRAAAVAVINHKSMGGWRCNDVVDGDKKADRRPEVDASGGSSGGYQSQE